MEQIGGEHQGQRTSCVVTLIAVLVATETSMSDIAEEGSRASRPDPASPAAE